MPEISYRVLIADDSADDVLLLKRAFKQSPGASLMDSLSTGQQVIDYFEGKGKFADRQLYPFPDVLILDLRMPIKNGFEVLAHLRRRGLNPKRVVILTSTARAADIQQAYDLGAQFIASKDADLRPLVQRLERALSEEHSALGMDTGGT